jgi:uncharacterized membrane protein
MTTISKVSRTILIGFFTLLSLAVYAIWLANFASGTASIAQALTPTSETGLPIFHYVAEFLMASVTLIGLFGFWRRTSWGRGVTLVGLGMFGYSALNSLGWAVVNDMAQGIPMIVAAVAVLVAVPYLLQQETFSAERRKSGHEYAQKHIQAIGGKSSTQ